MGQIEVGRTFCGLHGVLKHEVLLPLVHQEGGARSPWHRRVIT